MAELKSLIVNGITRLNNTGYAKNLYADKFITNGGTAQQYVKGDGTLGNISDFSGSGHNHDARYLRKDANDSTAYQYSFTKVNDHAIKVGTVRGTAVGSLTGEYIHLYERVHIGSPAGWGSRNAPSYGLSTYGGAWLATDTGYVGIGTTSPSSKLHVNGTSNLAGDTTIGTKSFYYQRSTRGAIHHEFVGNDADYGAVKIIHQSGEGSGGPGGFTASLGIFDERPATISGAYQPTFFINRTGATYVPDLIGVNNSVGRVFTITSYGNLFTGNLSIDNTAFTNSVTIFANQNDETSGETFTESKPSWGITFKRQWNSGTANTTSAGIYAVGSGSWRTGLAFRVKDNTTNTGSHDLTAIFLSPKGALLQQCNNSWQTPARVQVGRLDTTVYTDRCCMGATNGNLHIDAYKNYSVYIGYYCPGVIYFNGGSYYINSSGSYYNGSCNYCNYATYLKGPDNRTTDNAPSWYMSNRGSASLYGEFCMSGGAKSSTYEYRMTMTPWGDSSGQRPVQMAFNNYGSWIRTASDDSTWKSWNKIITSSNYNTTSVANLDGETYHLINIVTSSSGTISFSTYPQTGCECHLIIYNSGSSAITITMPSSINSVTCRKTAASLVIAAGSFGDVSILLSNGVYYIRCI